MAPHAIVESVTDTSSVVIPDPILNKGNTHPIFTIDHVLPHRQSSKPMSTIVAGFADAHMFKSKGALSSTKPKAKDFAHRLSSESVARQPSSLKGAMKYFKPDMISLCGGLPSA
jgi:aromatic amino acid aminotransferase I